MADKKILVIEDDADIREIISFYLEEEGFLVASAPDACDIVNLAKNEKPDLITMDMKLPKVDGPAAIGLLKMDPATASIPILIISVIAKDPKIQKISAMGYVAKPFEKEELISNVKRILTDSKETKAVKKILVVDDEPDVVNIISHQLRDRGFITLEAFNGTEAIEKANQEKPDLIILDIRMPAPDGFEVINILNQNQQAWSAPIVVLSGANISDNDKEKGTQMGVVRFLAKPFEPRELIEEIQTILCEKKKS
ncbi:MAG TPA: response regulator [Candidatus Omnitrophota bacterium]|nr:response regulator [Candidatus Omnitrophota bacterium]HPD84513.1 response regulator [Candidatus Omnitrophota bacterium]HRZ03371.1 response regulator [Candidatus Omnitrophota bacterium]